MFCSPRGVGWLLIELLILIEQGEWLLHMLLGLWLLEILEMLKKPEPRRKRSGVTIR